MLLNICATKKHIGVNSEKMSFKKLNTAGVINRLVNAVYKQHWGGKSYF